MSESASPPRMTTSDRDTPIATPADVLADTTDETEPEPVCELDPLTQPHGRNQNSLKLHSAVQDNDADGVRILLEKSGALIRDVNSDGKLPIHVAAHHMLPGMVALLRDRGSELDALDCAGKTQLVCEAASGNLHVTRFLLDQGADVNAHSLDNTTALLAAAENGHGNVARLLLERQASVDAADVQGRTPLIAAAKNGHEACVALLIVHNAALDAEQRFGRTALMLAVSNGHKRVVEILVNHDCARIANHDKKDWTALHIAAGNGRDDILEVLLDKGASVDASGPDGATPLFVAAQRNHVRIVEILIKRDANVNAAQKHEQTLLLQLIDADANVQQCDKQGDTSLAIAAARGDTEIVRALITHDATLVNAHNKLSVTPLHVAARLGHQSIVELLVESGATINATQQYGRTALMLAISNRHSATARYLITHKADVNVVDNAKWSVLHIAAASKKQPDIVRELVNQKASISSKNNKNATPLDLAIKHGASASVYALLPTHASPDYEALGARAIRYNRTSVMQLLFRLGNIERRDVVAPDGETVLLSLIRWNEAKFFVWHFRAIRELETDAAAASTAGGNFGAPLLLMTLTTLERFCDKVHVSQQSMYVLLLDRLKDVCDKLRVQTGVALPNKSYIKTLSSIAFRFGRELLQSQHQQTTTVARFIAARTMMNNLRDLHEEINALMLLAGLNDATNAKPHAEWQFALKSDRAAQQAQHVRELNDISTLAAEFSSDDDRANAIAHLTFLRSNRGRDAMNRGAVKQAIALLTTSGSNGDVVASALPLWFISRYDIELSRAKRVRANQFVKCPWLRSDVMVAASNLELKQFSEAATTWQRVGHPNVMDLYGAVHVGQPRLFVCCSVPQTLREYVRAERSRDKVFEMLHGAAQGLLYLHQRKIVHGRLTTDCIYVGDDRKAKIGGFDHSSNTRESVSWPLPPSTAGLSSTRRDVSVWTAPELEHDPKSQATYLSDVYAFGVCVFDILTMNSPWRTRFETSLHYYLRNPGVSPPHGILQPSHWALVQEMCAVNSKRRVNMGYVVPKLYYIGEQVKAEASCKLLTASTADAKTAVPVELSSWMIPGTTNTIADELERLHAKCEQLVDPNASKFDTKTLLNAMAMHIYERLKRAFERMQALGKMSNCAEVQHLLSIVNGISEVFKTTITPGSLAKQLASRKRVFQHHLFHTKIDALLDLLNVPADDADRQWQDICGQHEEQLAASERSIHSVHGQSFVKLASIYSMSHGLLGSSPSSTVVVRNEASPRSQSRAWVLRLSEIEYTPSDYFADGAFGSIFLGVWLRGTQVVIKFIKDEANVSTAEFLHEVRIWYQLRHPHVVRLWGANDDGKRYFVCEYASNGVLSSYVRKRQELVAKGKMKPAALQRRKWELPRDVALGLQYCHEANVVHNDLKSDNILVGDDGKAKLTDFGLSSMPGERELQITNVQKLGAIQWKAPEYFVKGHQLAGKPTFESDIYSFAMCIIEVIQDGKSPWGGSPDPGVKNAVKEGKLPPRPAQMTDAGWDLVQLMAKNNPVQRVGIAFVVTKLQEIVRDFDVVDYNNPLN